MNERIKELAEQAGFDVYGWNENELEEFAVLIVKECIELGDKALRYGKWPGDVMGKHFGVDV